MNYHFEGINMTYKMVQNLAQSNDWIKKSTFWPYPVRVFGPNCYQRGFECCNPLIHYPIMLHFFATLFLHWNSWFAPFLFYFILFYFWHVNWGRIKYRIDNNQLDYIAFNLYLRPHIKATISTTSTPPSTNLCGSLTKSTMVHNHRKKNSNLHAIYNHTFYDMLYPKSDT